jgi:hypothetical protein
MGQCRIKRRRRTLRVTVVSTHIPLSRIGNPAVDRNWPDYYVTQLLIITAIGTDTGGSVKASPSRSIQDEGWAREETVEVKHGCNSPRLGRLLDRLRQG